MKEMIHSSHRRDLIQAGVPLAVCFVAVLLLWISPTPSAIKGWANYLPLHMALETVSIFFAGMIFAITWHTPRAQTSLQTILVGCVFAGVALLDFSHMLSYSGMPAFVSPSGSGKAIYFWLAARTLAGLGLLTIAFKQGTTSATRQQGWLALLAVVALVAVIHWVILWHFDVLPQVFVEGQGLTSWKVNAEYILVCAYSLPVLVLARKLGAPRTTNVSGIMASALLMAMSEFMLTLYADVTDLYNLAGHVLKVAAYFYLYQPLFIELLQVPYERLREAMAELQATLRALPDLLFEVDEEGVFLAAHTGRPELLVMPPSAFLGKTMQEVLPGPTANIGLQAIQEAKAKGVSHGKLYEIDLNNERYFFELSVAPKPHAPKEKPRYIFIARDITERVRGAMALEKEARFNAALIALPQEEESTSVVTRFEKALASLVSLTESQTGFMAMVDTDGTTLSPVAIHKAGQDHPATLVAPLHLQHDGIWSKAIRERRPVLFNQSRELPGTTGLPPELADIQRWIALPIFDDKQLVMLAGIGNKASAYVDSDVEFLQLMAYGVWQLTHKQKTDKALRRFSLATSQNPNPVIITDLDARIEYVNEAFTKVTGYSAEEVIGKNPRILQSGKTSPTVIKQMWSQLNAGKPWTGELINRRKNKQEYYENALIYPVRDEAGVITHYLAHKQDVSEKKTAAERIQYLSEFDQLTGLPNRTLLLEQLQFELSRARLTAHPLTVLWLNLDLFKDINDAFGHAAGDSVLREVAHRLREITQGRDIVARYSGDNFILVRQSTNQYDAIHMAEQVLNLLSRPIALQDQELVLTASIGLALYPSDGTTATDLMRCAETAMYRVKRESRNSFSFYSPDMQAQTARSLQLTNALKLAIQRGELRLVYQPQVDLQDGRITGAEALLRWHHPQLGDVPPAEFIPLAENAGLSMQVGEWVFQRALTDLRHWNDQGIALVKIAVNLSASQFAEANLASKIGAELDKSGITAQWLELELTEVAAMKNPMLAAQTMSELSALGLSLSIDDFGTGYSSLSYLKRFEVYKLKIDQSFVRDVVDDPEDQAIVTAIINMAHSLGMITLAEGVETPAQLAFLRAHHCDEMQGFLFKRPMEREDFEQLLRAPERFQLPV